MSIVFQDRIKMFWNYLRDIFYGQNQIITIIFIGLTIFLLIKFRKKFVNYSFIFFLLFLSVILFLISLLYRDNFWVNYYEGIQYIFLFLIIFSLSVLTKIKNGRIILNLIIIFLVILNTISFIKNTKSSKNKVISGLKASDLAIKYIYQEVGKNNFCLKIYTPPVIPYTYDYLTLYYSEKYGYKKPYIDFYKNKCWYIIETDYYKFRLDKWKSTNIPKEGVLIKTKRFTSDYSIELWSLP